MYVERYTQTCTKVLYICKQIIFWKVCSIHGHIPSCCRTFRGSGNGNLSRVRHRALFDLPPSCCLGSRCTRERERRPDKGEQSGNYVVCTGSGEKERKKESESKGKAAVAVRWKGGQGEPHDTTY